jgi:hypothetical protein
LLVESPASSVPPYSTIIITTDQGPVYSNGTTWIPIATGLVGVTAGSTAAATANTAAIQAALTAARVAGGGVVTVNTVGIVYTNGPITIGSNTVFNIGPGCIIKLAPGSIGPMIQNYAFTQADVNVSALTSTNLTASVTTSTPHPFPIGTVAANQLYVAINWATPEYYSGVALVLSVADSTHFTYVLNNQPSNTTASASPTTGQIKCRQADTNITINNYGAIDYNYPTNANGTVAGHTCILFGVYNYYVTGNFPNANEYAITPQCCTRGLIQRVAGQNSPAVVQAQGPIHGLEVDHVEAYSPDDLCAFGTGDYAALIQCEGAITGLNVKNLYAAGGSVGSIKFFGSNLYSISAVADGCYGSIHNASYIVCAVDNLVKPDGNLWIKNLTIQNVIASIDNGSASLIQINSAQIDNLILSNIESVDNTLSAQLITTAASTYNAIANSAISGNATTVTVTSPNHYYPGQSVIVSGVVGGSGTFNGTFTVATSTPTQFTYAASGNGTPGTPGTSTPGGQYIENLYVRNVFTKLNIAFTGALFYLDSTTTIKQLVIDNFVLQSTGFCQAVNNYGTVGAATLKNGLYSNAGGTNSGNMVTLNGGTITSLTLDNCNIFGNGSGATRGINLVSGTVTTIKAVNTNTDNLTYSLIDLQTTNALNVEVVGCSLSGLNNNCFRNSGVGSQIMTIRGYGNIFPSTTNALTRPNAGGYLGQFTLYGDIPTDPLVSDGQGAWLTTTAGQSCYSTRTGATKQGPSVLASSLGSWVALGTGAAGVNTVIS